MLKVGNLHMNVKSILFFGGTFDPVHLGHVNLCKAAIKKVKPDLTIIMPNKIPPLKVEDAYANAHDRIEMLKLAFKNIPKLTISDHEAHDISDIPSYTYKTIKWLKRMYPKAIIHLLVGYDRLKDFNKWKNYQYILDNVKLVVGIRSKDQILPEMLNAIKLNYDPIDISGKQLRENIQPKYLDQNVLKYIRSHYLYLDGQIRPYMNEHRFNHTKRVVETAIDIAINSGYEALNKVIIAGYFHDICKQCSEKEILKICEKADKKNFPTWHTMHGLAASIVMEEKLGIKDREILNAVKNHCVPSNSIDTLGKIIYLADKLEPARTKEDIPNRKKYLNLACKDVDEAFKQVLKITQEKY